MGLMVLSPHSATLELTAEDALLPSGQDSCITLHLSNQNLRMK